MKKYMTLIVILLLASGAATAWEQDIGTQTFDWAIGTTQVAFHYNF